MRRERLSYFAYVPNNEYRLPPGEEGPNVDGRVLIEWVELDTSVNLGEMEMGRWEFWRLTRDQLWEKFNQYLASKTNPSVVGVSPIDESSGVAEAISRVENNSN